MAEGDGVVKSAGRVLGLLQVFAEHRRPMRVSEIAQAMGVNLQVVYNWQHHTQSLNSDS